MVPIKVGIKANKVQFRGYCVLVGLVLNEMNMFSSISSSSSRRRRRGKDSQESLSREGLMKQIMISEKRSNIRAAL